MNDTEVLVIGGGVAGLFAAMRLSEGGRVVTVLEARDRVGGRILSAMPAGWPHAIELGAEFIHTGNRELSQLLQSAAVKKRPVEEQHWLAQDDGRKEMPDAWDRIDGVMSRIGPRTRGDFASWLRANARGLSAEDRALAIAFVRGFQGASPGRMSAPTLFKASQEPEEQFRPDRRYDVVVQRLAERALAHGAEIRLNDAVRRVRWQRGRAHVEAKSGTWHARAVLVTVPLGVLQARAGAVGSIRFEPRLRAKENIWRAVESGHARRIVLRMRGDIWRRGPIPREMRRRSGRAFGFVHSEADLFPVWWSLAPAPLLVGWTGGPGAKKMSGWSEAQVLEAAVRTLGGLLGCAEKTLRRAVIDFRTHDWAADPFTRGAYSFSVAGQERAPLALAKPVAGTLFFAGEATADPLELGTVHGALQSAARAVTEVESALP